MNAQWDKEQLARTFLEVYKIPYPVGRDVTGEIGELYKVEATPTSVFVGKDGRLVENHVGELEEGDFSQRIDEMLMAKDFPPKPKAKSKPKPQPKKRPRSPSTQKERSPSS